MNSQSIDQNKPQYEGFDDAERKKPLYQIGVDGSAPDPAGRTYFPYFPTKELQEAVNLAIILEKPILIDGEPGCGKTRLAEAIAYEFSSKYLCNNKTPRAGQVEDWWYFQEWNVKSVGRAQDGLYTFDAVGRLRDAQLAGLGRDKLHELFGEDPAKKTSQPNQEKDQISQVAQITKRLKDINEYLKFGALGSALKQQDCLRPIVLIDEIDKADSDFPNDLLRELDRLQFTVTETDTTYPHQDKVIKPIVIITSNRERPLSEAFLRRCLYFRLDFPNDQQLQKIICERYPQVQKNLIELVIEHFREVRDRFADEPGSKPPGTSEILDFVMVLQKRSVDDVKQELKQLGQQTHAHLLGVVLKTERDQQLYRGLFRSDR